MVTERKRGMRMQDRYLSKAKRKDNGEWVQGVPFEIEGKTVILINDTENLLRTHYLEENMWTSEIYAIEVDPSTICQCTGLKDKNGNLIWENDIVSYCDCTKEDYVISWEQNKACFEYQQYSCSMMNFDELSSCEVEVVGNVFDNPELLEM
nr:MAG TPA: YopX protein [Caudoviricetes sp.]